MSARDKILGRIRASLSAREGDTARWQAARRHIATHSEGLVPARARLERDALEAQFRAFLEGQTATVLEAATADEVPARVAAFLLSAGAERTVRIGGDPRLAAMPWSANGIDALHGAAAADDAVGLSHAMAGIAETGTLVIAAGAANPVTLAFLPATHVIVVAREDIVGSYEEALARVRGVFGPTGMPRTLNFISGPSRTADIGGKIVIGAHGPRSMCVVVVG
ncbi:MAG: lactate utilization protein C [Hyphomicrobiaceae bacterium]